ncbi:MAG: hypothetical protein JWL95_1326 [Gemmatimonadetes bacterium]|nr:hypothetical protein [Gemmatimonadota bacterium]
MRSTLRHYALLLIFMSTTIASTASAQQSPELPFAPGERFTYAGRVRAGVSGSGTISVDAPSELRGTSIWVLHSDMQGKLGPIKGSERTASWLDPVRMATLRYTSTARHLFTRTDDAVDVFAEERRWKSEKGLEGATSTEAPLDELSFLFYLRTLPLAADTTLTLARHFDVARNPTIVRVVGREEIDVGAGRFRAIVVEMKVRDTRRYRGEGTIRIHLSDDRCRLILRLESNVPDAGTATLALVAYEGVHWSCSARLPEAGETRLTRKE